MGVSKASPHQGKMFFQPFSIHIFRCSRLILIWGLWYMFGCFTNIRAIFTVFVATDRANGNEIWCRSCTKQKCYGANGEEHEAREQHINLNSTLDDFHVVSLGRCHLPNGRKTRLCLISLKSAWEPSMLCRWRVRHNTASLTYLGARNHYLK